ncbi:MAG: hypothetical protein ACFFG0_03545 [Candidatus Thorarchaeota archaeon]
MILNKPKQKYEIIKIPLITVTIVRPELGSCFMAPETAIYFINNNAPKLLRQGELLIYNIKTKEWI